MAPVTPKKPTTLPMLTEMRGVAALLIYHMHLAFYLPVFLVLKRAYLGVDFFFILSGFVLTHVYRDWFCPKFRPGAIKDFLWARFGRIYPLQFVTATIYVLLLGFAFHRWQFGRYLVDVFLLNALARFHALNPVSWSIAAECVAYAFAPFLIRWIASGKSWRIPVAFVFSLVGLLWVIFIRMGSFNIYSSLRCLPEFTFGICCYEFCRRRPLSNRVAAFLFAAGILLPMASLAFVPGERPSDLVCVLSFCLLISAAVHLRGAFVRGFSLLFGYLGEISYSLYLTHPIVMAAFTPPLIKLLGPGLSPGVTLTVYLMTTSLLILFASLSYRYVELPARAFFKRRTRRHEITPAPTSPTGAELAYAPAMDDSSRNR